MQNSNIVPPETQVSLEGPILPNDSNLKPTKKRFKKIHVVVAIITLLLLLTSAAVSLIYFTKIGKQSNVEPITTNRSENSIPAVKQVQVAPFEIDTNFNPISLKDYSESSSKFGDEMLQKLFAKNPKANINISPLSFSLLLSMLYLGSSGETEKQIANVLHTTQYTKGQIASVSGLLTNELKMLNDKSERGEKVIIANNLWFNKNLEVNSSYLSFLNETFKANPSHLDTDEKIALEKINKWISDSTEKTIPNALDQLPPDAKMVLVNTLYFKGEWEDKFKLVGERVFQSTSGPKSVGFMQTYNEYASEDDLYKDYKNLSYFENEDYQFVSIPYKINYYNSKSNNSYNYSMNIILPKKGLSTIITSLPSIRKTINEGLTSQREDIGIFVKLTMPKFKFGYEINPANEILINLGMVDAFTDYASFPLIASDILKIDRTIHKTHIDVNEFGTVASAATIAIMSPGGGGPENVEYYEMMVDEPFYFSISGKNGETLFEGVVNDPQY